MAVPTISLNGTDVTSGAKSGSFTRRLSRPSQAQITVPVDYAPAAGIGVGAKLKIEIGATMYFHGFVLLCETTTDENFGYTVFNATDPLELWSQRPARAGPDSADPGDFSKPELFLDPSTEGPEILHQVLLASENVSLIPAKAEGPLFLDLPGSTWATGGVDLSGAPVDYPMTIAQVAGLLTSTGEVDIVVHPIDDGTNMGTLTVANGNYGNDLSGSVIFEFAQGARNIRSLRWNDDMSTMNNKLWYYGGPRVGTVTDPAGDQHWCFNVTGTDALLPDPPFSRFPTYSLADLLADRDASRAAYGVRMEVKIFDAESENCRDPVTNFSHQLYRQMWVAEQGARMRPREIIHITPTRDTAIGSFDVGDLVGVEIDASVRGGASGGQRVYEYTVSWDEDNVLGLEELQTAVTGEF